MESLHILLIKAFHRHKSGAGVERRDRYRFGISFVALVRFDEWLHKLRRDHPYFKIRCNKTLCPIVARSAGLKGDVFGSKFHNRFEEAVAAHGLGGNPPS